MFVCVPPGTYKAFADIDVNVDGLLVSAPSGASIVFGASNVQFFVRGNGNTVQNLNINCDNSAASGFVITGGGNVVTGCSVRRSNSDYGVVLARLQLMRAFSHQQICWYMPLLTTGHKLRSAWLCH